MRGEHLASGGHSSPPEPSAPKLAVPSQPVGANTSMSLTAEQAWSLSYPRVWITDRTSRSWKICGPSSMAVIFSAYSLVTGSLEFFIASS